MKIFSKTKTCKTIFVFIIHLEIYFYLETLNKLFDLLIFNLRAKSIGYRTVYYTGDKCPFVNYI